MMIKNLSFTPRLGLAPANSLTIVEQNRLDSWDVFLSLFSSFTEGSAVDIVFLQDHSSSTGFLPSFCGFKSFAPPRYKAQGRLLCIPQIFAVLCNPAFFFPRDRRLDGARCFQATRLFWLDLSSV